MLDSMKRSTTEESPAKVSSSLDKTGPPNKRARKDDRDIADKVDPLHHGLEILDADRVHSLRQISLVD